MSLSPETPSAFSAGIDRRSLLRRAAAAALVALPAAGLLEACAGNSTPTTSSTGGAASAKNPLGVDESAPLEVVIFDGGYHDTYATKYHIPEYKAAFPKAADKVKESSTQDIQGTLQPRFSGGNPPDVVDNSGTKYLDFGALIQDNQLQDLTKLYDAPSVDDPSKKVRDTLVPGTIEFGSYEVSGTSKPFVLNYAYTVYGLWYNKQLWAKNGWTPPKTWSDFTALLDKIKAAGIVPYSYAGANASYYQYLVILTSATKMGGTDILKNIDNLEDGAWMADAVKQSATAWGEIGAKYSDKANLGLKHTDVQLKQDQDKVAIYPSGSWLESEQKDSTPATFTYNMFPVPSLTSSDKLEAEALYAAAGEPFIVAAKGKNPLGGMEYLRQMLSKAGAQGFTKETGSLTAVQGAAEGLTLTEGTKSANAALSAAKTTFAYRFDGWYKDLDTELRAATNELFYQGGTADKFCSRMQAKADAIKKDSSITKFKR